MSLYILGGLYLFHGSSGIITTTPRDNPVVYAIDDNIAHLYTQTLHVCQLWYDLE